MKTVTIQGIEIPLREVSCVCDNKTSPRGDFVNISVNLTNQCQYECAFCCNPVRTGNDFNFRLIDDWNIKAGDKVAQIRSDR